MEADLGPELTQASLASFLVLPCSLCDSACKRSRGIWSHAYAFSFAEDAPLALLAVPAEIIPWAGLHAARCKQPRSR
jgi:hypothetical protein